MGEQQAAVHLLTGGCLRDVVTRVMGPDGGWVLDPGPILAKLHQQKATMSHGEQAMFALACNLWHGRGSVSVRDLVGLLDKPNFARAIQAIGLLAEDPELEGYGVRVTCDLCGEDLTNVKPARLGTAAVPIAQPYRQCPNCGNRRPERTQG